MELVSIFLLCLASQGSPSGTRLSTGSASIHGVSVSYQTYLEPGSPSIQRHGGGVLTENNTIKRHIGNTPKVKTGRCALPTCRLMRRVRK